MTRFKFGSLRALLLFSMAIGMACGGQDTASRPQAGPPLTDADIADLAAVVKFEDTRQFDAAEFTRLLQSDHPEVRRRAVVAVGRIVADESGTLLDGLRTDADTEVVASVAFAYGQLKSPAPLPWLGEMLQSGATPEPVAFEAARALGKIRTPEARALLATYLTNAPMTAAPSVVGEALLSMGRYSQPADVPPTDVTPMVRWATSDNTEIRWRAAWALFRPRNPAAIPELLKLSDDPSPEVRFWAVRGLAPALVDAAGVDGIDRAVTAARLRTAATSDADRRVRTEAVRALAAYDDDESFEVLLTALNDQDTWMSVSAAEAMGRFESRVDAVVPALTAAVAADRPAALRVTALAPLAQLAPVQALAAADAMLRDNSLWMRTTVTQLVRRMGEVGRQKLDELAADPSMKDLLIPAPPPRGGGRGGRGGASAAGGGPTVSAEPARTDADYRAIVERWIVPAYNGAPAPRAIWMTPKGEVEIELHPGDAPLGMEELVRLTDAGSIVGTIFSRVVPNFVDQQATITGANRLRDEVSRLGLNRGTLAWASAGLDTGRPGYTLASTPQPHNEGDFTSLGHVVRGMEVVDTIELGDAVTAARIVR